MSHSPGNEPQAEKQVEKVSTLSLVRRDTALMLRDFRQGASNWIHSLLDSSRASASPSTDAEAPPGATGIPPPVIVCVGVCLCVNVQSGGRGVGSIIVFCLADFELAVFCSCNLLGSLIMSIC